MCYHDSTWGSLDTEFMNQNSWGPCYVPGAVHQLASGPWGSVSHAAVRNPMVPLGCVSVVPTREATRATKQAEGYNFSSQRLLFKFLFIFF